MANTRKLFTHILQEPLMKRPVSLFVLAAIAVLVSVSFTLFAQTPPKTTPDPEIQKMVR
jgi:hypothetical protein